MSNKFKYGMLKHHHATHPVTMSRNSRTDEKIIDIYPPGKT